MELKQYLTLLWKWAWLIVLCLLLAGGAAYVVSERQPPTYQATTTLLISQASSATFDASALLTGERLARTCRFLQMPWPARSASAWCATRS